MRVNIWGNRSVQVRESYWEWKTWSTHGYGESQETQGATHSLSKKKKGIGYTDEWQSKHIRNNRRPL